MQVSDKHLHTNHMSASFQTTLENSLSFASFSREPCFARTVTDPQQGDEFKMLRIINLTMKISASVFKSAPTVCVSRAITDVAALTASNKPFKAERKGHCKPRQLLITVSHTRAVFVCVCAWLCVSASLTDSLSVPCCALAPSRFNGLTARNSDGKISMTR